MPDPGGFAAGGRVPESLRRQIREYYLRKRLVPQKEYFERRGVRSREPFYRNRRFLLFVFFASLALLFLHWAWESGKLHGGGTPATATRGVDLGVVFLLGSVALLGLFGAFKSWRHANEFGRNQSRSAANGHALAQIERRLERDPAPDALFGNLAVCEYVLAADQDEWLRLMMEAEWFA